MALRVAMLGDIVGRPGRLAVMQQLPIIRQKWSVDLIVANAENSANGSGLTPEQYQKLTDAGIAGITLGDHVYRRKEIVKVLERESNIIRPANLPDGAAGKTWMRLKSPAGQPDLFVLTLLGRRFIDLSSNDPFATADQILKQLPERDPLVLVEMHAEATSEKQAMGWHLNGRVAAVVGTHTHVATADARILPCPRGVEGRRAGTAYITDLGMSGPYTSVIGRKIEPVLMHLTTAMPVPFDVAEDDPRVCGVCIEFDTTTRRAVSIERIELKADVTAPPFTM